MPSATATPTSTPTATPTPNADRYINCNSCRDSYVYSNTNGYLYSHTHGDVYADDYTYGDGNTDRDGDSNSYRYCDSNPDSNTYADPDGDSHWAPNCHDQSGDQCNYFFRETQWLTRSAWVDDDRLFQVGHDNQLRAHHRYADPEWEYVPEHHCQHQRLNGEPHLSFPNCSSQQWWHQLWQRQDIYHADRNRAACSHQEPSDKRHRFFSHTEGSVDPHGLTTTVYFQYGTTTSYGRTTANQSKTGNTYQNVSANISGLTASTTYHFRIKATNSAGTRYGSDRTFTTTP
jgi:hypothetical protein